MRKPKYKSPIKFIEIKFMRIEYSTNWSNLAQLCYPLLGFCFRNILNRGKRTYSIYRVIYRRYSSR